MSKLKSFAKYWLPVIVWAVVIFSASGDSQSVQRSSRIIEPIVRWLCPNASEDTVHAAVFFGRKCAHVTEYAIFAMILCWALRGTQPSLPSGWSRRFAFLAWSGAAGFAITDELHQVFVPGRQGSVWDVVIDSIGAAAGLLVFWLLGRWRKKW